MHHSPPKKCLKLQLIPKQNKQNKCKKKRQTGGSTKLPTISIERANLKHKNKEISAKYPQKNHKTIKQALSPKGFELR